jgi:hypothetical protein
MWIPQPPFADKGSPESNYMCRNKSSTRHPGCIVRVNRSIQNKDKEKSNASTIHDGSKVSQDVDLRAKCSDESDLSVHHLATGLVIGPIELTAGKSSVLAELSKPWGRSACVVLCICVGFTI